MHFKPQPFRGLTLQGVDIDNIKIMCHINLLITIQNDTDLYLNNHGHSSAHHQRTTYRSKIFLTTDEIWNKIINKHSAYYYSYWFTLMTPEVLPCKVFGLLCWIDFFISKVFVPVK